MAAGLKITAGNQYFTTTVDNVRYTFSTGSPIYVPKEHRSAVQTAATAAGVTLSAAVL